MNTAKLRSLLVMATAGIALAFPAGSALADKPEWAGGGKQKKEKSCMYPRVMILGLLMYL